MQVLQTVETLEDPPGQVFQELVGMDSKIFQAAQTLEDSFRQAGQEKTVIQAQEFQLGKSLKDPRWKVVHEIAAHV